MYHPKFYSLLLYSILYVISVVLVFYIPGSVMLRSTRLRASLQLPLSITIGIGLWALQGFVFGFLQLRWLTYAYLLIFVYVWIRNISLRYIFSTVNSIKHSVAVNKRLLLIIVIGVFVQLSAMWFTMIPTQKGLFYCCGDPNDNTWFAAVTNELIHSIPPRQPGMYGVPLQNYHFLSNLVVAETARVFHIPYLLVQYQFNTILLSVLYGLLAVVFGRLLHLSDVYIFWLLFFLYFGSDAMYVTLLTLRKGLNFSMSSLEDGVRFLVNLPRAYAMVMMLGFLNLFIIWLKDKKLYLSILIGLIAGSLVGFKVYAGIFVLAGLCMYALYEFLRYKDIRPLAVFVLSGLVTLGLYLPINAGAGGLYFTGLWRFENFIVQPALGLVGLEQARVIYAQHNNWIHVAVNEGIYIAIFIFSIFGSKLAGLYQTKSSVRKIPIPVHIVFITGMLVSLVAGLFFNQTIGSSNTFNFLVSVFIIMSFYAALTMTYAIQRLPKICKHLIIFIVILATIPRIIYETSRNIDNLLKGRVTVVSKSTMDAVNYLQDNTKAEDVIFIDSRNYWYDVNAPMFAVLTDRPMYLSGKTMLNHFGVNTKEREIVVNKILQTNDQVKVAAAFTGSNIDYMVSSLTTPLASTESAAFLPVVYRNQYVVIQKVDYQKIKQIILSFKLPQ